MPMIVLDTEPKRLRALDAVRAAAIDPKHPLCVIVRPYERARSSEQNRRYWAMLRDVSEQARPQGVVFEPKSWHEYFAEKWLPHTDVCLPNGRVVSSRSSTTDLSAQAFSDYMTKIEVWADEHDIALLMDY